MTSQDALYPAMLQIAGKLCTVIGGGRIATRKATSLLRAGARVRVISPAITSDLRQLVAEGKVEYLEREYREGDASGGFLVVAATNQREVNRRIGEEADDACRFVNIVDDAESSSYIVPAAVTHEGLQISISTLGKNPGTAKRLRELLVNDIAHGTADFQVGLRRGVGERVRAVEQRDGTGPRPDGAE